MSADDQAPTSNPTALTWRPSPHARRNATILIIALLLGLGFARPAVAGLAAIPLAYLVIPAWRRPPADLDVQTSTSADQCFENEPVRLRFAAHLPSAVDVLRLRLHTPDQVQLDGRTRLLALNSPSAEVDREVRVTRWGRRQLGAARLDLFAAGGLLHAATVTQFGELAVFPSPAGLRSLSMPATRIDLAGDHLARAAASGVEFAGIRPFVVGDNARRINWPVSSRLGRLHVTETIAERGVDVVIALDVFNDVGPPGMSTLDITARGATGLARQMLQTHDRVGLVAIGGWLRWVRADVGSRQFYRVASAMLDVIGRESFVDPDLRSLSPAALPPGSIVVFFSPLLDNRALRAIQALRGRGHPVTVIDVLGAEPPVTGPQAELAVRLWRLDRAATRFELSGIGVPVLHWDDEIPLDAILQPVLRMRALR